MVNDYNFAELKMRFGGLLSSLHDTGFTDEYITNAIITNPYFDMFENNDLSNFSNNSLIHIISEQFNKDALFSFSKDSISDYIWAGEIYITIMLNNKIPLKQLFIICPLEKMISYFPLYHEMHNIEITKTILELREKNSILKELRNSSHISLRKLSFLTGINLSTLSSYEKNNESLFSASLNNIIRIKDTLRVSLSCFKKESSFIPFTSILFNNEAFKNLFVSNLLQYNKYENNNYIVVNEYQDNQALRKLLKRHKLVVSIYLSFIGVISTNSNRLIFNTLSDNELLILYDKTIKELNISDSPLIF